MRQEKLPFSPSPKKIGPNGRIQRGLASTVRHGRDASPQELSLKARALQSLKDTYGHDAFRGKQWEAIEAICRGRDTLVLMPTGAGKTVCYAIPALLLEGLVLVVSPLIALVQDQVRSLSERGVRAALINSSQTAAERDAAKADALSDRSDLKMLFVTPELLASAGGQALLERLAPRISFLAVDEAHCISSWGHDFRKAYRQLSDARKTLHAAAHRHVPVMALTATATPEVRKDIRSSLSFVNGVELMTSFNRPNIKYSCVYVESDRDHRRRIPMLLRLLSAEAHAGEWPCAIVYALRRADVDLIAEQLRCAGLPAGAYHAGSKNRAQVLVDFQTGSTPIMVATIAFGMGIDKAGVRFVVHYNVSRSIAAFYQESGRAGRDGDPCRSVVFVTHDDLSLMAFLAEKDDDQRDKQGKQRSRQPGTSLANSLAAKFSELRHWCLTARCRRSMLLERLGEHSRPCRSADGDQLCDVCEDLAGVESAMADFRANPPARAQPSGPGDAFGEDPNDHVFLRGDFDYGGDLDGPFDHDQDAAPSTAPRSKRRVDADAEEESRRLRARLGAGYCSDDDAPVVKHLPRDVTTEHRAGIVAKLESALCKAAAALCVTCSEVKSVSAAVDGILFAASSNKIGYYGRARSLVAHLHAAKTVDAVVTCADPGLAGISDLLKRAFLDAERPTPASGAPPDAEAHSEEDDAACLAGVTEDLCKSLERTLPLSPSPSSVQERAVETALALLQQLKELPMTAAVLRQVPFGKRIKKYARHSDARIAAEAAAVISAWKARILENNQ